MVQCTRALGALLGFIALATPVAAQGSSRPITGSGCPGRVAPAVSGPLTIGSTMRIDALGCFTGQAGSGLLALGLPLPSSAWVPLTLSASRRGPAICFVAVQPLVALNVTRAPLPILVPIPNDPSIRGFKLGLQTFCRECGVGGCFDVLTAALEVTIG